MIIRYHLNVPGLSGTSIKNDAAMHDGMQHSNSHLPRFELKQTATCRP